MTLLDHFHEIILFIDEYIWYLGLILIVGIGLILTIKLKGVQFSHLGESIKLTISGSKEIKDKKTISSLEAFWVSMGARIGVGNIAGVGLAIIMGGAGAIFWMWVFALIGAASSFAECTLGQIFKEKKSDGLYHGGPAYYVKNGLKNPKFAAVIAFLIVVTYGIGFIGVQSSNATSSFITAFDFQYNDLVFAIILAFFAALIVFGGVKRVAKASAKVVPIMTLFWLAMITITVLYNWRFIDDAIVMIFKGAFGYDSFLGGAMGAAIIWGLRRGVFSNEAGIGSVPNVSSSAEVGHPVKQGLMQSFGVMMDTIIICSGTAFVILTSPELMSFMSIEDGAPLVAATLGTGPLGYLAPAILSVFIILFAFTSIISYYSMSEANVKFISEKNIYSHLLKVLIVMVVFIACLAPTKLIWDLCDVFMAILGICNMIAVLLLSRYIVAALKNYNKQKLEGKDPIFYKSEIDLDTTGIPLWEKPSEKSMDDFS